MKKILMLGGSAQQVVAIRTARQMGYYTVLCDYLPDNPGQYAADKFYLVSTIDKEAVLEVARQERVDGVVAYASDPAAPTAAALSYLGSSKAGLPASRVTIPPSSSTAMNSGVLEAAWRASIKGVSCWGERMFLSNSTTPPTG